MPALPQARDRKMEVRKIMFSIMSKEQKGNIFLSSECFAENKE